MSGRFVHLFAVTRRDRLVALDAAKDAVSVAGGWIVDARIYSNKMATLIFELPLSGLSRLAGHLAEADIRLDDASEREVAERSGGEDEARASLQMTFLHADPDLRSEIPAVPG